jgi:hypothetical protein
MASESAENPPMTPGNQIYSSNAIFDSSPHAIRATNSTKPTVHTHAETMTKVREIKANLSSAQRKLQISVDMLDALGFSSSELWIIEQLRRNGKSAKQAVETLYWWRRTLDTKKVEDGKLGGFDITDDEGQVAYEISLWEVAGSKSNGAAEL